MMWRFPGLWFDYAPASHRFLVVKWFDQQGIVFDKTEVERSATWNPVTRVLTVGDKRVVTKTPPPWPRG